eukprot:jgi/Galph1/4710/GphlegSOOS_G3340.1
MFWQQVLKASSPEELTPLLHFPNFDIAHIYVSGVFLVATIRKKTSASSALELLHYLVSLLVDYFGEFNEHAIKENFVTVYEIIEEFLDHGFPFTVEVASLKELVPPPSLLKRVLGTVTSSSLLPKTDTSDWNQRKRISWRNPNTRYAHNEIFVDIIEELSAIVNAKGEFVHSEIVGNIIVNCRLSGMPELTLYLNEPSIAKHCFLHPCVRYARFLREGMLSFAPPDGVFKLLGYQIWSSPYVPVSLEPHFALDEQRKHGRLQLTLDVHGCGGKACEEVIVSIPFTHGVKMYNLSVTKGVVSFDSQRQLCKWTMTSLETSRNVSLTGDISSLEKSLLPLTLPSVFIDFRQVISLSVQQLNVLNESYKPYKGLRRITKSRSYEVRPY